jgi:Zn-dependent protease with chaperone function
LGNWNLLKASLQTFWKRNIVILSCLVTACAQTYHVSQPISDEVRNRALAEIQQSPEPQRRNISAQKSAVKVQEIYKNLLLSAYNVCYEVGEDDCWWDLHYSEGPGLNAYAFGDGSIVIQRDILVFTKTDDEVAFVVAHELGHHIANHLSETARRRGISSLAVAMLYAGVSVAILPSSDPYFAANTYNNLSVGAKTGSSLGGIVFSVAQELEADYLAAMILADSGYDLGKSRSILITMSKKGSNYQAGIFDTHPAGPDRLAAWDRTSENLEKPTP